MSIDNYGKVFELKKNEFSGFLSDSKITDIDEDNIATTITIHDITKWQISWIIPWVLT